MNSLISVTKAAEILATTPFHVLQLCRNGELPCGDLDGTMVIPEMAVREYAKRIVRKEHAFPR